MPPYAPPADADYAHVETNMTDQQMLKFMGKGGHLFKVFTEFNNLDYVWWNKDNNVVEIWGPYQNIAKATHRMRNMLHLFKNSNKFFKRYVDVSGYHDKMICKNIVSNFKWIRNEYKIKYIWWNPITKVIEFHGNSENTITA